MFELFVLWLLLSKRGGAAGAPSFSFPASPPAETPKVPANAPTAVTPAAPSSSSSSTATETPKTPNVRASGYGVAPGTVPGPNWRRYHPPPAEVVRQAQAVLRLGVMNLIGPDPERPGRRVYYQREFNPYEGPQGHTRITAWAEK
jgi:hypothetical protein